jgi:hypothetical protein
MRLRRARNAFPHARGALVHQLGVAPLAGQLRIESIRLTRWRKVRESKRVDLASIHIRDSVWKP